MTNRERLKNLANGLIDNIIRTPGTDILKEVEEDHGDPEYEANIVRKLLKKAKET